jgi:hypothetical protein
MFKRVQSENEVMRRGSGKSNAGGSRQNGMSPFGSRDGAQMVGLPCSDPFPLHVPGLWSWMLLCSPFQHTCASLLHLCQVTTVEHRQVFGLQEASPTTAAFLSSQGMQVPGTAKFAEAFLLKRYWINC